MKLGILPYTPSLFYLILGIDGWYRLGDSVQVIGFDIPTVFRYAAYPSSFVTFSLFGILLAYLYGLRGIPMFGLCVFSFDPYGSLATQHPTPWDLWVFWGIAIPIFYFLSGKPKVNILNYGVLTVLGFATFISPLLIGIGLDRFNEIVWEACWCFAFYETTSLPRASREGIPRKRPSEHGEI